MFFYFYNNKTTEEKITINFIFFRLCVVKDAQSLIAVSITKNLVAKSIPNVKIFEAIKKLPQKSFLMENVLFRKLMKLSL